MNSGKSVPIGMSHETFWFRAHGIEGFTHVEENHDPRHCENQPCFLPVWASGDLEHLLLTQGVGLAAGAFL